ncbi:dehydrogenase [Oleiphilus messinensis]|uniref:Dehydrogenase n=1 Tax=Oleiphilus messinensis TaxID=141451 RepID=A0A1Y0I6Q8_9GAMM|nr:NAD(P)/FAD-dependent oxidoreductase [Oleiphilus messinensis]ARU55920.1 dehydrogenase [Oleiphilus messinensis]
MLKVDVVVIGGGLVGLAIARALAVEGYQVVLFERNNLPGEETSSRNSEVIHAGIYYPQQSLKAELCVRGKQLLYDYCERHKVAYHRCGKFIVATNEAQIGQLERIKHNAMLNGVTDLDRLSRRAFSDDLPGISALEALYSPSTGIVDSHGLIQAYFADAENAGAMLCLRHNVLEGAAAKHEFRLQVRGPDGANFSILSEHLITASGLHSEHVLQTLSGLDTKHIPCIGYAKGSYFALTGKVPYRSLIYPVPEPGGLGVHLTLDLAGRARFGPDVEWVEQLDYRVDHDRKIRFVEAIRRYWPDVPVQNLTAEYSGIRPKLVRAGEPDADFLIQTAVQHQIPGLINLLGIESPGLTASLALAERVTQLF